jgi:histidine triad (HIT) family protein
MKRTIFDEIVEGDRASYKVWGNENFLAFLTPFPNTPGFTVLIPKRNPGNYIFRIDDGIYAAMMKACKEVANILEKALETPRVALVFEGTGVAYVHAKLIPLHGKLASETNVWSKDTEFNEKYRGWLTTSEGPQMDDARLKHIQEKIVSAQKS